MAFRAYFWYSWGATGQLGGDACTGCRRLLLSEEQWGHFPSLHLSNMFLVLSHTGFAIPACAQPSCCRGTGHTRCWISATPLKSKTQPWPVNPLHQFPCRAMGKTESLPKAQHLPLPAQHDGLDYHKCELITCKEWLPMQMQSQK